MQNETTEETETIGALMTHVHEAATDAAASGYPRVGRLLDECGFALGARPPSKRTAVEQRARKALALWTALQLF